jgi:hypothetical protein
VFVGVGGKGLALSGARLPCSVHPPLFWTECWGGGCFLCRWLHVRVLHRALPRSCCPGVTLLQASFRGHAQRKHLNGELVVTLLRGMKLANKELFGKMDPVSAGRLPCHERTLPRPCGLVAQFALMVH